MGNLIAFWLKAISLFKWCILNLKQGSCTLRKFRQEPTIKISSTIVGCFFLGIGHKEHSKFDIISKKNLFTNRLLVDSTRESNRKDPRVNF